MNKGLLGTTGLIVAFALLVGITIISDATLRGARVDLTEGDIYSLSDGSRKIVGQLDEPIRLTFFYSRKGAQNIPFLASYAERVEDLLKEYEDAADGNIKLEIIDPEPFSEEEDRAVSAGIQPIPRSANESLYFGLEAVNSTDEQELIAFFSPERDNFLEYDLTSLIHNLANPDKQKVGIITALPMNGSRPDPSDPRYYTGEGVEDPWIIMQFIRQFFEVEMINIPFKTIPEDVDTLMIVHPQKLGENELYAIDQFVLSGRNALIFTDPHADVQPAPKSEGNNNPIQSLTAPKQSNMTRLFRSWGLDMAGEQVAADRKLAMPIQVAQNEVVSYILFLGIQAEQMNTEEFVTANLDQIMMWTPGFLQPTENATTEFTPLFTTTTDSEKVEAEKVRFFPDAKELIAEFEPLEEELVLAARVSGDVKSAFGETVPEGANKEGHRTESEGPINVVVVADADMLSDRYWVRVQRFLNQQIVQPQANNGDFVVNVLEYLGGSRDLISVRSRGKFSRPFVKVQELEQEAKEEYFKREQELQTSLREIERRINELQTKDQQGNALLVLSEEQKAELAKAREKRVETRKDLRKVQNSLNGDIEALGRRVKAINIGLVPLLVGIFAVLLGIVKVQQRKRR